MCARLATLEWRTDVEWSEEWTTDVGREKGLLRFEGNEPLRWAWLPDGRVRAAGTEGGGEYGYLLAPLTSIAFDVVHVLAEPRCGAAPPERVIRRAVSPPRLPAIDAEPEALDAAYRTLLTKISDPRACDPRPIRDGPI